MYYNNNRKKRQVNNYEKTYEFEYTRNNGI